MNVLSGWLGMAERKEHDRSSWLVWVGEPTEGCREIPMLFAFVQYSFLHHPGKCVLGLRRGKRREGKKGCPLVNP